MKTYPPGVVLHVPHNSTMIPPEVRGQFVLNDDELHTELIRMTDHWTLDLFSGMNPEVTKVVTPFSRLVVDAERYVHDELEPMSALGMGVIYMKTSCQKILRNPIAEGERQKLIERYYRPHHEQLNRVVKEKLALFGRCLVIDCHSFPSIPLPYESDKKLPRPDICIGTDDYHTPKELAISFGRSFEDSGFTVSVNSPFSGTLVPSEFYRKDLRVSSIMVEICRRLYIDEITSARLDYFASVSNKIIECCRSAIVDN